jgi:hypothetical protein
MNPKARNILGWMLAGLVFLLFFASAADKISGSEHALKMSGSFGIAKGSYRLLGWIELGSALLFLVKRTGLLGTILLASYMGGAIATHLQHGQDIIFPAAIEALVWVAAVVRFPESYGRLFDTQPKVF